MAFTSASKDAAVNALTALGDRISLHSSDPGTIGSGEISGGSYSRQQTTWGSSSSGTATGTQLTFSSVPAGSYTHYGVWSSGGTFRWGFSLSPGITLSDVGTVLMTPRVTFP